MANVGAKLPPYVVNFLYAHFLNLWDITVLEIAIQVHRIAFSARIWHKRAISGFHMGYDQN